MTRKPVRQGDVLLIPIEKMPTKLRKVPCDAQGRIVLAEGEVTGHAHVICDEFAELFAPADLDEMADRFLKVEAEGQLVDSWKVRMPITGEIGYLPAYQSRGDVEAAGFAILGRMEVEGVVVRHEEHLHTTLTPGAWTLRPKREYAPEAPRQVMD